jgi:hypothetical protein
MFTAIPVLFSTKSARLIHHYSMQFTTLTIRKDSYEKLRRFAFKKRKPMASTLAEFAALGSVILSAVLSFGVAPAAGAAVLLTPTGDQFRIVRASEGCGVGWWCGATGHCHP